MSTSEDRLLENKWMGNDSEDEGPSLSFQLEEDLNRKDQLFSFRKEKEPLFTNKAHKPGEQELLQEGKLGDSEFSARLQKVVLALLRAGRRVYLWFRWISRRKRIGAFLDSATQP